MDVRCSRCATEYEFDDALISERGTTVKCTNCGFQFKIFPPKASQVAPERWVVKTGSGRELVFTSLRELQRGISERQVGPEDLLSRGTASARPLGSIPELEPFFSATTARANAKSPRTLAGVAPPPGALGAIGAQPAVPPRSPTPAPAPTPAPVTGPLTTKAPAPSFTPPGPPPPMAPMNPAVKAHGDTGPFSATLPAAVPGPAVPSPSERAALAAPPTVVETRRSESLSSVEPAPRSSGSSALSQTLKTTPSRPMHAERASGPVSSPRIQELTPPPSSRGRGSLASYDEVPVDAFDDQGRRARSRWIAAVVILGLVVLFALTLGRQYLKRLNPQQAGSVAAVDDERVNRFLRDGTKLLEEGDVEGAKEQFVKAQALADKSPRVLAALARLETVRADITWLKLRLLDPQSTDLVQSTHRDLGRRVGKAREAAEAAFKVDPEALPVVRARVDAFRLSGEPAREWVGPLAAKPQDPQNAYVLAALDLAEQAPDFESDIKRFELAAASTEERVRGRAALIYALGRAGRVSEAERQVTTLESDQHQHPLLEELKSFVARLKGAADAGADAAVPPAATVDVSKLPALDTSPGPEAARAEPKGDFRKRLVQANEALRGGNLARAEQLYQSVLSEQPGNTEALSGLADVARRNNDHSTATRLYQRVLEQNPSYLPALIATADSKWNSGDHKGAVVLYRRVLDQAGAGTEYGQRAAARIAEAAKEGADAPAEKKAEPAPEKPAEAPEQPAPPSEPAPAPSIDTTDLPGIK
jgi:predicted Zn finger-like uncharacterized protein